ncbi:hypothetical protein NUACC21_03350 [Scytonema sp. NUACC21]
MSNFICANSTGLSQLEGIIPALETAHAIAYLEILCPQLDNSPCVIINCSAKGDKDVQTVIIEEGNGEL